MPDRNGWHIGTGLLVDGHRMRWHFCPGRDVDALVEDTAEARKAHERECGKRARETQRRAQAEARKRSLEGLKTHGREKRLERKVLAA